MAVKVIDQNCITCGACVGACPVEALRLENGPVQVDEHKCTDCSACVESCPAKALEMGQVAGKGGQPAAAKPEVSTAGSEASYSFAPKVPSTNIELGELGEYQGVWVYIEQNGGQVAPVSWELLGEGRKLADKLGVTLAGVVLGDKVGQLHEEIFGYGADRIYSLEHPTLGAYRTYPYMRALIELVHRHKPEIILMGATTTGRDLSGAVATRLGTGLTADCTILDIDPKTRLLEQTRPAFGGNIMATITCKKHRPQMATVRPRVMDMPMYQAGRAGEVISESLEISEEEIGVEVIRVIQQEGAAVYLDKADIIVAGGRGIGNRKVWEQLEELSRVLGATVGASRAAVEAGWAPLAHQVGQTGQTVRPKIYLALGISGAIQHLVGMQTADCIVAINSDPEAPIFKVANYGIVGDVNRILPLLIKQFREVLAGGQVAKEG